MVEVCRQRLRNSLIRVYVCLSVLWKLVQSGEEVACSMPKWGITYMGSRNVTKTGKACQAWSSETPHPVNPEIKDEHFPDGSKEEAQNFCRNPYPATKYGVWCYTTDTAVDWEYCDTCPGAYEKYSSCTLPDNGRGYTGKIDHSQSYKLCDPWSSHQNSEYKFPDGSAEEAKNYCRNPDPKNYEGPWCFIKGMPGVNWDFCDICKPFQGELKQQLGSYNEGSVKIAEISQQACIHWCITWQSCVAVSVPHNEYDAKCWYFTSLSGNKVDNDRWDQYNVMRVCNPRAQGKAAYFIPLPQYPSYSGTFLLEGSEEECDNACIAKPDCVMYDRDSNDGKCYAHYSIEDSHCFKKDVIARHIIRCVPSLKPLDISDTVTIQAEMTIQAETPASSPQPSEEPLTDATPPEDEAATSTPSIESTAAPKKKGGLAIVIIVVVIIAVIAIGGGGFAYYKLVYQKGKKDSKEGGSKDERQKLTSKKPTTPKTSKGKK